ncbi:hypothetical protein MTO96_030994 [Rhipicephalus appendiculatus]
MSSQRFPLGQPPPDNLRGAPGFGREAPRYAGELSPSLEYAFLSPAGSSSTWSGAAATSQASQKPTASSLSSNTPRKASNTVPPHESSEGSQSNSSGSSSESSSGSSSRRSSSVASDPSSGTSGTSSRLVTAARLREDRRSVSRLTIALLIFTVLSSSIIAFSLVLHGRFGSSSVTDESHGGGPDTSPKPQASQEPLPGGTAGAKRRKLVHRNRKSTPPARGAGPAAQASTRKQPNLSTVTKKPKATRTKTKVPHPRPLSPKTRPPKLVGSNSSSPTLDRSTTGDAMVDNASTANQAGHSRAATTGSSGAINSDNTLVRTVSPTNKKRAKSGISSSGRVAGSKREQRG